LPQYAVDVNRAQTKSIGENILAEWAFELNLRRQPDQVEPFGQLHEKIRRALDRAPVPNAGEDIKRPRGRCTTEKRYELPPPHVSPPQFVASGATANVLLKVRFANRIVR
jgi:hypothetical protein